MAAELVRNINPGSSSSSPSDFAVLNDRLFFAASGEAGRELWVSDGTATGTQLLGDINFRSSPENLTEANGKIYFSAENDFSVGRELWVTDGTEAGTELVKNINTSTSFPQSSDPEDFVEFNGKTYFSAYSDETGIELWETDGTEAGTELVKDINPTRATYDERRATFSGSSDPSNFAEFNGKLYFSTDDDFVPDQLWVTDGTEAGTQLVSDRISGSGSADIRDFATFNDRLYFSVANNSENADIWVTDGTEAGTQPLDRCSSRLQC